MDFGYGRGFSGNMAFNHLMGLSAAASGPQSPGRQLKARRGVDS